MGRNTRRLREEINGCKRFRLHYKIPLLQRDNTVIPLLKQTGTARKTSSRSCGPDSPQLQTARHTVGNRRARNWKTGFKQRDNGISAYAKRGFTQEAARNTQRVSGKRSVGCGNQST